MGNSARVVEAWLTAIAEHRLPAALEMLAEGWTEVGTDGFVLERSGFVAAMESLFSDGGPRLVLHGQVESDGYVATQLSWVRESRSLDVLRLDAVEDGRILSTVFHPSRTIGT